MKYTMSNPCADCPFLNKPSARGWLGRDRAKEIADSITTLQQSFPCHKTTVEDENDETVETKDSIHCAGALILLEKINRPNQMMRIAERLGMYNRFDLNMEANVFHNEREFIDHHDHLAPTSEEK